MRERTLFKYSGSNSFSLVSPENHPFPETLEKKVEALFLYAKVEDGPTYYFSLNDKPLKTKRKILNFLVPNPGENKTEIASLISKGRRQFSEKGGFPLPFLVELNKRGSGAAIAI